MTNNSSEHDDIADEVVSRTETWPAAIDLPPHVLATEHVESDIGDSQLDVTWFTRDDTTQLRPAMIFVHGGAWRKGDKKQFYRQAAYLTERYDIFGVCVEYRLSGVATYPAALEDCKCAIRWTRSMAEKHQIDTQRIGICGGSAGAHLSAMVATTNGMKKFEGAGPYQKFSSDVHLAVLFNGHFDMGDQLKDHVQDGDMHAFFGGHPWEIPEVYGSASPFLRVTEGVPPMLLLHGDQDHYPHRQSIAMYDRLRHYGVHAELEIYQGKPHAWFNHGEDNRITTERISRFITERFQLMDS